MRKLVSIAAATPSLAYAADAGGSSAGAPLALLVLIVAVLGWLGLRSFIANARAKKTEAATGGRFPDFALAALVNAAKIDGRVGEGERQAIASVMSELTGAPFDRAALDRAFAEQSLGKNELVAYLETHGAAFSHDQKVLLLKALLQVFAADGNFDDVEHAALIDYTEAVGFDRRGAPERLRGLLRSASKGNII